MDASITRKGEWVLTQAAFDMLLACLDKDRERAGEQYETIRQKLVKFFEWRGSSSPDQHADETINRVARKIAEGETIQNLQSYFYGVARLLFMESLKEREREQAAINQLPEPIQAAAESNNSDSRLECFEKCMRGLPAENRELIVEYYEEEKRAKIDKRKVLAEKLGLPLNALRIRAHRIRAKLEDCVHECVKK